MNDHNEIFIIKSQTIEYHKLTAQIKKIYKDILAIFTGYNKYLLEIMTIWHMGQLLHNIERAPTTHV